MSNINVCSGRFAIHKGYEYARTHNPTRALVSAIAELESPDVPAYGTTFASGMAAITTITQMLESGSHVSGFRFM